MCKAGAFPAVIASVMLITSAVVAMGEGFEKNRIFFSLKPLIRF